MPLSKCFLAVWFLWVNVSCLPSCLCHYSAYTSSHCHPVCVPCIWVMCILSVIISVSRFFPYFFILLCLILLSMSICRGGGPYFLFFNEEKLYSCLQMHFFNPCQFVLEQWLAGNYLKTYTVYISIVPVAGVLCVQAFPSFSSACILVIINIMR